MDVSRKSISRLDGYPSYAEFISKDRDAAVYRRFGNLNARNLLYMQSELHELERQLEDLDKEDLKDIGNEDAQKAARIWESFSGGQSEAACARRLLQCKVRGKVKEYCQSTATVAHIWIDTRLSFRRSSHTREPDTVPQLTFFRDVEKSAQMVCFKLDTDSLGSG